MRSALKTIVFMSLGLLGGCSWIVGEGELFDRSDYDYTNAEITKELEVPESIGESNEQDHFLVPELEDGAKGIVYGVERDVMAPMQVLTLGNKVRANTSSDSSAAYVIESEIKIWDAVERFLLEENIPTTPKDISSGTVTTGWALKEDDSFWDGEVTAWRYRYQITVGDAERSNESTIFVKMLDAEEFVDDTSSWRTIKDTQRIETEFLNSILGFMYVEDLQSSRTRVNQSGLGGIIISLGTDNDNNPALITSSNFEHVWTRIPISLNILNITVSDQDRSQGLFFINNKDADEGFISSLAFWSSNDVEILELPREGDYVIKVSKKGDGVSMTFMDNENNALSAEVLSKNFATLAKVFKSRALD